jgi:hypothetical protein
MAGSNVAGLLHPTRPVMEKWSTLHPETFPSVPSFGFLDAVPEVRRPVALPLLLPGTMINVQTKNTMYRLTVIDGAARQISINGGRLFPCSTDVTLLGAIDGEEAVKFGWIVEGLQLQLITPDGPVVTSTVESVEVDVDPASSASMTGEGTE